MSGKVYIDIRDYLAKDSGFLPTRRGVTLTKPEWYELCAHAEQTGLALVRICEELNNDDD